MKYKYLYIYQDNNTVIQLYRSHENENIFILDDGCDYPLILDFSSNDNKQALDDLNNGKKKTYALAKDRDGYVFEMVIYTSANAAFGL